MDAELSRAYFSQWNSSKLSSVIVCHISFISHYIWNSLHLDQSFIYQIHCHWARSTFYSAVHFLIQEKNGLHSFHTRLWLSVVVLCSQKRAQFLQVPISRKKILLEIIALGSACWQNWVFFWIHVLFRPDNQMRLLAEDDHYPAALARLSKG
jgi:hypothetical protein